MSNLRVQEGEDEDAISTRPTDFRRSNDLSSARNSLNMTWPPRPGTGEHRPGAASSSFGSPQGIISPAVLPEHVEEAIQRKPKGVRFFFAEDVEPAHDISEDDSDNDDGVIEDERYDDAEVRAAIAEAEADEEVMRRIPESIRLGLSNLDLEATRTQDDPIDHYYDNDGEEYVPDAPLNGDDGNAPNDLLNDADGAENKKDQERLDRFMQPASNSDEGVLELNRERIDWQSMLQSVLTGEVFKTEQGRLKESSFAIQPAVKQQIWLGLRATLRARAVGEEKRFVNEARSQADAFLQEVMDFKVNPESEQSPLDQVLDVLQKVDTVESMYPKLAAIENPLYNSAKFQYRLDALNSYASVMKKMKIQTKILRNWTGSETLEVSRSKGAVAIPDEVSFVDRLLKENGLQRTFEKSTLSSLHNAMTQIKETMIENAVAFASMGLVPTMSELQALIRFPTTLMQECLRLRLEYADRVTVPTLLNVDQMLEDFKTSLFLACKIKYDYYVLESSEDGWFLEPCIDPEYETVLKSSLQFYFKLLSWKVEYWGQSKKYVDSVLDLEWKNLSDLGQQIDGIGLDTAEQLCLLTSKSTTFLYTHLQDQIKERPDQPQPAGEITKFYGKMLENVRLRANKLRRFSRDLTDTFENAAEYLLDRKKGDSLANLMNRLAETHVMVFTNQLEAEGAYIIVEHKVAENPLYIPHTLRSCFEQRGTGYILIFTPLERFVWTGPILSLEGDYGFNVDLKPGRLRLISERGSQLETCKKRFDKFAEPFGLEVITESRANVSRLNKELSKTKKAMYKLADTIVQSVTVLRKVTMKVSNCQDLVQPFFRFASEYGIQSLSSMEGLPRSQFNLKLLRLAIDWVSFVCDDCDQSERKTFRWAMPALVFAMNMTKGNNILALSDSEFSWLRSKIACCMTLLISHFDIHGARSQSEALRMERDGRTKDHGRAKDHAGQMNEIKNILQLAMAHEKSLSDEASLHHRQQVEKLVTLDKGRTEREQDIKVIGKVLDDQKPEDRSLVFLAALTDSVAIRWQMAKYIGSGTFGTVYLATNSDSGELIAVKEIRFQNASMSLVKSIRDEMKVMKMMHHPNIVRYDNIEVHRHKVYIFMEYCQGGSLADLLEHGRIEDEKVIKFYTLQMLKGLAYLHDKNVVHRDVKPDNILLDHLGNIKFVDFGAAKILAKNQRTRTHGRSAAESVNVGVGANSLNGTPMYMAPEVIKNGEKGRKGSMDIWSLGCCVLEMATGRRPWAHLDNEWAVMYHVATSHPPLPDPSQMSLRGIAFLKRCFTRSSSDRPSAVELLRDDWLRGVDSDEGREDQDYEEQEAEVDSDEEMAQSEDGDHALMTNGVESHDHDMLDDGQPLVVTTSQEGVEDAARKAESPFRSPPRVQALTSDALPDEEPKRTAEGPGNKSPDSCESVRSDTVSEVGSEVEMMLSALREREECSRQASKQSSPLVGPALPGGGSENVQMGLPTVASVLSNTVVEPTFAAEMGLDLYSSSSPVLNESRVLKSPILTLKLMGKQEGSVEEDPMAGATTIVVSNTEEDGSEGGGS